MSTATDNRTYHKSFPLKAISFDPSDNYRWGSKEAMERDITAKDTEVDGEPTSSFEVLKRSIATSGVSEPVGLRKDADGKIRVIYGFTRVLASQQLNLKGVPAFVYEDLTEDRIATLQMAENSSNLKRGVNWLASTRMYIRLVDASVDRYMSMPVRDRPTDSRGYKMSPRRIAEVHVCDKLGVSVNYMSECVRVLKNAHPLVIALAEQGRLSANTMKEFISPDPENPYSDETVAHLVAEVTKSARSHQIPSSLVRRVIDSKRRGDKQEATNQEGDKSGKERRYASDIGAMTGRMSAGLIRDVATNYAGSWVEKHDLGSAGEDPKGWTNALVSSAYCTIVGLALASGDIPVPESAQFENGGDVSQASRVAKNYAKCCFLRAVIRYQVKKRQKVTDYSEWLATNTPRNRTRRFEVQSAIDAALQDAQEGATLRSVFLRAWDYMLDSGTVSVPLTKV